MTRIVHQKFLQVDTVKDYLFALPNCVKFFENSPHDKYWGIGPDRDGKNKMGVIWASIHSYYYNNQLLENGVELRLDSFVTDTLVDLSEVCKSVRSSGNNCVWEVIRIALLYQKGIDLTLASLKSAILEFAIVDIQLQEDHYAVHSQDLIDLRIARLHRQTARIIDTEDLPDIDIVAAACRLYHMSFVVGVPGTEYVHINYTDEITHYSKMTVMVIKSTHAYYVNSAYSQFVCTHDSVTVPVKTWADYLDFSFAAYARLSQTTAPIDTSDSLSSDPADSLSSLPFYALPTSSLVHPPPEIDPVLRSDSLETHPGTPLDEEFLDFSDHESVLSVADSYSTVPTPPMNENEIEEAKLIAQLERVKAEFPDDGTRLPFSLDQVTALVDGALDSDMYSLTNATRLLGFQQGLSLASHLYSLIKGFITGNASWVDITLNILNIGAAATALYVTYTVVKAVGGVVEKIISLLTRAFAVTPHSGDHTKTIGMVANMVGLIIAGGLVVAGESKGLNNASTVFATGKNVKDFSTSVIDSVGDWCGIDISGRAEMDVIALAKIDECNEYLTMPMSGYTGDKYTKIVDFVKSNRQYVVDCKEKTSRAIIQDLLKLNNLIDDRLRSRKEEWNQRVKRVTPVGIWLWSSVGGVGKSDFASYMPRVLSKMVKGFNDGVYSHLGTSRHYANYTGEHTMHADEVGSVTGGDPRDSLLSHLNDIVSPNVTPSPSANLEGKNQILKPHVVLMTANQPTEQITRVLTNEAHQAFRSRLNEFEFVDPKFDVDRDDYRNNQPHRKSDFSHIVFRKTNDNGPPTDYSAKQFFQLICTRLASTYANYAKSSVVISTTVKPFQHKGLDLTIPDFEPHSGVSDRKFVHYIAGQPGVRKSTDVLPLFREASGFLNHKIEMVTLPMVKRLMEEGGYGGINVVYVLDDTFQFNSVDDQSLFMQFYNNAYDFTKFVILSNFGPCVGWFRGFFAGFTPISLSLPGLPRRLGFEKSDEARLLVKTITTLTSFYDDKPFSTEDILADWFKFDTGAVYPKIVIQDEVVPTFEFSESDMWLKVDNLYTTVDVVKKILVSSSIRMKKFLIMNPISELDVTDLSRVLKIVIHRASKEMPDLKVYVSVSGSEFIYQDDVMYMSPCVPTLNWVADDYNWLATARGDKFEVTAPLVQSVHSGTVTDGTTTIGFTHLAREKRRGTALWLLCVNKFPPKGIDCGFWLKMRSSAKSVWEMIKKYKVLLAVTLVLVVLIPYLLYTWFSYKSAVMEFIERQSLPPMEYIYQPQCNHCVYEEGEFVFSDECPGSSNYSLPKFDSHAKGKNKSRSTGSGRRYSSHIKVGGRMVRVSETENTALQPILHDGQIALQKKSGFSKLSDSVGFKFMDKDYTLSYTWVDDKIQFSIDDFDAHSRKGVAGMVNNLCTVTNETQKTTLYGLFMTSEVVRFPAHIITNPTDKLIVKHGENVYTAETIAVFANKDTVYAYVKRKGKVATVPNVQSIIGNLVSMAELPGITHVYAVDPERDSSTARLPFEYQLRVSPPIKYGTANVDQKVAFCAWGGSRIPFLKAGNCGTFITANINNKEKLVGMYSGAYNVKSSYMFPLTTLEDWNDIADRIATVEPHSTKTIVEVPYFQSKGQAEYAARKITTDFALVKSLRPLKRVYPETIYEGGLTSIGNINNPLPIDQKNDKTSVLEGKFEPLFGDLKSPSMSKAAIEKEYPHLIPEDDAGIKQAQNVRLFKSGDNTWPVHPSFEHLKSFEDNAFDLGEWWRVNAPPGNFTPYSVEDAIWGGGGLEPLDLNTSVGAAAHTIWPGCLKKKDYISTTRGEFVGPQGAWLLDRINYQWQGWKTGELYMLPASYSLKNETLTHEKKYKKRVISISDVVTVINFRRVLMPLQNKFTSLTANSPYQLVMNPLTDMDELARKLKKFKYLYDIDVSSFDMTVPYSMFRASAEFLKGYTKAGPTLSSIIDAIYETTAVGPSLCGTVLMTKDSGVPSGITATSFVDSIIMQLIFYFTWQSIQPNPYWGIPEDYYHTTWTYSTGDDTILASNDPDFTGQVVLDYTSKVLGMKFTDPDKVEGEELEAKTLEQLSYAGRSFLPIPGFPGFYSGKLRITAMSAAFMWSATTDSTELYNTLFNLRYDVALYGREKYELYSSLMTDAFPEVQMPRYTQSLYELHQEVLSAPIQRRLNKHIDYLITSTSIAILPISKPKNITREDLQAKFDIVYDMNPTNLDQKCSPTTPRSLVKYIRNFACTLPSVQALKEYAPTQQLLQIDLAIDDIVVKFPEADVHVPQFDSPNYIQQILRYTFGESVPWISKVASFDVTAGDTKAIKNSNRYVHAAGLLKHHPQMLTAIMNPFDMHSESVQVSNTAEPPTIVAGSSAGLGTTNTNVVGVVPNSLAPTAISNDLAPMPTTGAVKPSTIMETPGGVGPELQVQTANDMNLLTLAGTKIFKKIVSINTGVAQGVTIFDFPVNPWNPDILNRHAYAWAKLHKRFYGALDVHFQIVTAATIIGTIKIAFIPAVYSDSMSITQENLDAFGPAELVCNVNGEGSIPMVPTAKEFALTGIYRDSTESQFGRLVCITATNIENAYTNSVGIQIKLAFSLREGSFYDLPYLNSGGLYPDDSTDEGLGLEFRDGTAVLVSDGLYDDGLDYTATPDDDQTYTNDHLNVDRIDVVPYYFKGTAGYKVAIFGGHNTIRQNHGYDNVVAASAKEVTSSSSYKSDGDAFTDSPILAANLKRAGDEAATRGISYRNGKQSFVSGVAAFAKVSNTTKAVTIPPTKFDIDFDFIYPEKVLVYSGEYHTDALHYYASYNVDKAQNPHVDTSYNLPGSEYSASSFLVEGVPIATVTASVGTACPPSYYNAKVVTSRKILPSVAQGLHGHSMDPDGHHLYCSISVANILRGNSAKSVITTIKGVDGVLIAQVVRNTRGMFISRTGISPYTRCDIPLLNTVQTHQFSSEMFPQTTSPNKSLFKDRSVTSPVVKADYGGYTRTGRVPESDMDNYTVSAVKVSRDPGIPHAGIAIAAGIGALGSLFGGVAQAAASEYGSGKELEGRKYQADLQWRTAQLQAELARSQLAFAKQRLNGRLMSSNPPIGKRF